MFLNLSSQTGEASPRPAAGRSRSVRRRRAHKINKSRIASPLAGSPSFPCHASVFRVANVFSFQIKSMFRNVPTNANMSPTSWGVDISQKRGLLKGDKRSMKANHSYLRQQRARHRERSEMQQIKKWQISQTNPVPRKSVHIWNKNKPNRSMAIHLMMRGDGPGCCAGIEAISQIKTTVAEMLSCQKKNSLWLVEK